MNTVWIIQDENYSVVGNTFYTSKLEARMAFFNIINAQMESLGDTWEDKAAYAGYDDAEEFKADFLKWGDWDDDFDYYGAVIELSRNN